MPSRACRSGARTTRAQVTQVKATITKELNVPASKVSTQVVGASWGGEIQKKAWQALVVFMILIIGYLSVAFYILLIAVVIAAAGTGVVAISRARRR